ncbi:hypothetical protein [Streptomyces sp. NPDC057403]|uniref:hypothetical protein n=1 Tax=Streptomyces sp. NPDC057403 TaxID=3346119 RepID=UPI0036C72B31
MREAGGLRSDVTAEDIAASLIGIFTVAPPSEHEAKAGRLLNLLMDGQARRLTFSAQRTLLQGGVAC